jgi:hypothetical protein
VYNAQDMSYLSVERVDSSEQTHPRLWPRWRRGSLCSLFCFIAWSLNSKKWILTCLGG